MTTYESYERFHVKRENGVLTLTYRGVSEHNFIDGKAHTEMATIFDDIAKDTQTNAVVFTGAGRIFCGGAHVDWLGGMSDSEKDRAVAEGREIVDRLLAVPQPIVAAVNGPAIGLGATLALFSDIIIASESAVFADPHVVIGLTAGDGGAVIWPWLIGMSRAKEFLFTGDRVAAGDALRMGLVNHVVPPDQLYSRANEIADRLAALPIVGLRTTKTAVNKILRDTTNVVLDYCLASERYCMSLPEHDAAMAVYLENRG
jgi:enoyl-CoA hydratase